MRSSPRQPGPQKHLTIGQWWATLGALVALANVFVAPPTMPYKMPEHCEMSEANDKLSAHADRFACGNPRLDTVAGSRKRVEVPESPPKLRLTISDSLSDLPVVGVWSRGPVYQPLDPDFLAQPRIPKAPPTPRLQIDSVDGSLRVVDALDSPRKPSIPTSGQGRNPPTRSQLAKTMPQPRRTFAQFARERRYRLVALVIGFGAGITVAMLLHGY